MDPSVFASDETKRVSCPLALMKDVNVAPKGRTVAEAPDAECVMRIVVLGMFLVRLFRNGKQQRLVCFVTFCLLPSALFPTPVLLVCYFVR